MTDLITADLALSQLHGSLEDPALRSMDFLNEVAERYPAAISLAAGRPHDELFEIEALHRYLRRYCAHLRDDRGFDERAVTKTLFQYGPARGVVNDLVAHHLAVDEDVHVDPASVVITVGCQEAIFLTLRALRSDDRDVMLAVTPTYVGLTGAARLVDMPVLPVPTDETGVSIPDLVHLVRQARRDGRRPRALYVMPDFANPSGTSMNVATRRALLQVAADEDVLLLEDNPYGHFHGAEPRPPTLKALDERRRVVYLGSFAKTVLPGVRIGYVVADQVVGVGDGTFGPLAAQLSRLKSMLTVNTPPVAQAVAAGKLLEHGCSLASANVRERAVYRRNMERVLQALESRCPPGVTWNAPRGGFFVVVTVPFRADDETLESCARRFGVLWTPMSHFYGPEGGENQLRLSCSAVSGDALDEGLDRFLRFVADKEQCLKPVDGPGRGVPSR